MKKLLYKFNGFFLLISFFIGSSLCGADKDPSSLSVEESINLFIYHTVRYQTQAATEVLRNFTIYHPEHKDCVSGLFRMMWLYSGGCMEDTAYGGSMGFEWPDEVNDEESENLSDR